MTTEDFMNRIGDGPYTLKRKVLWENFRVEAPVVERPDGLLIRASTHFYNNEEEIARLAQALAGVIKPS